MTNYSDNKFNLLWKVGNHNDPAGKTPSTRQLFVYDRSGNGKDGTTNGSMFPPK